MTKSRVLCTNFVLLFFFSNGFHYLHSTCWYGPGHPEEVSLFFFRCFYDSLPTCLFEIKGVCGVCVSKGSVLRFWDCVPALLLCGSSSRSWWCCWVCICWLCTATSQPSTSLPTVDTNTLGKCHFIVSVCYTCICSCDQTWGKMVIHLFVICLFTRMIFTLMCGLLFGSDGYYVGLAWASCALMFFIVSGFYSHLLLC